MKVLQINNLTKHYGRITAVNQLNLDVEQGQIMGVLGPNGSGKTTTLGIVLGITKADSGDFQWFEGQYGIGSSVLTHVGSLLETPNFYPYMTAEENLAVVAHIKRAKNVDFNHLLQIVNLAHRKDTPFRGYSLGMKQRLAIAATMVGDPDVLIFDEPTNGLDPTGIAEVRETIKSIAAQGKTIFMASHILDEVEKVCSHVAIIKNGNLLATGEVGSILGKDLTIEIGSKDNDILRGMLSELNYIVKIENRPFGLSVNIKQGFGAFDLSQLAFEKGIVLTHLVEKKRSLEQEFLEITSS
ncbi:MAG: ATP-binding cassette domain-containing protein [Saprospiraceae bacterium]|nr:ATP-binding cassette domain-containing protein [Saprospiraceae bacterium]